MNKDNYLKEILELKKDILVLENTCLNEMYDWADDGNILEQNELISKLEYEIEEIEYNLNETYVNEVKLKVESDYNYHESKIIYQCEDYHINESIHNEINDILRETSAKIHDLIYL